MKQYFSRGATRKKFAAATRGFSSSGNDSRNTNRFLTPRNVMIRGNNLVEVIVEIPPGRTSFTNIY